MTALEPAADDPDVVAELAHHALAALPVGEPAATLGWVVRAAELAAGQLAYEQAARLYVRAAEVARGVYPQRSGLGCSS